MKTEDIIKLKQDAQSKLNALFGSECVMTHLGITWLGADKYMIEIKVNIAGVPFECHSTKGITKPLTNCLKGTESICKRIWKSFVRESRCQRLSWIIYYNQ